jgi:hypothetical protein
VEVLVDRLQRSVFTKVDADAIAHDGFAVESLTHGNGVISRIERAHNAAEGLQRGPGSKCGGGVDDCAELVDMRGGEDGKVGEVLGAVSRGLHLFKEAWGGLTVIKSVLVGCAGAVSGGRHERSSERCDAREEARDRLGEAEGDRRGEPLGVDCFGASILEVLWQVCKARAGEETNVNLGG